MTMCTVEPRAEWRVEDDECTPGERLVASLVSLAVRLWCLPFLLLVWVLGWTTLGAIRGAGAVANLCVAARAGRASDRAAIHPGMAGPRHLTDASERAITSRA